MVCAALLMAACGAAAPDPPARGPALYHISDTDTDLYVFGTMHMLPEDVAWQRADILNALAGSRVMYVETLPRDGAWAAFERKHGFNAERDTSLSAAVRRYVDTPPERLSLMQPWLAQMYLESGRMRDDGYKGALGADAVLKDHARARGVEIKSLETLEESLGPVLAMTAKAQTAALQSALDSAKSGARPWRDGLEAWLSADPAIMDESADSLKAAHPDYYAAVIGTRNDQWMQTLLPLMETEGQYFVAVGALHVAGTDGLAARMARGGYNVELKN